jgi:hypothetical protein
VVRSSANRNSSSEFVSQAYICVVFWLTGFSTFVFDTGSSNVLIPSSLCDDPGCITHQRYDPYKSETFKNTTQTFNESFFTGGGVDPTQFYTTAGFVAIDTVSIGGLVASNQTINAVVHQSDQFAGDPYDGIFGFSFGDPGSPPTFFQELINTQQVKTPVFGFYLSPVDVGHAELTLGGYDSSKFKGPLRDIPIDSNLAFNVVGGFYANFSDIVVNGHKSGLSGGGVLDTGTTNLIAPTNEVAQDVYKLISDNILLVNELGIFAAPCDELETIPSNVSFVFGGIAFQIPSRELNVGPVPEGEAIISSYAGRTDLCQAFINGAGFGTAAGPAFNSTWIIGGSLLKYYYSVYDYSTAGVQFAETLQSPNWDSR